MAKNKDGEFKQFLVSSRKKIRPGLTNAPVWVLQKAGKRIWNPKSKRTWKDADLGKLYRKRKHREKAARRRQKE